MDDLLLPVRRLSEKGIHNEVMIMQLKFGSHEQTPFDSIQGRMTRNNFI